MELSKSELKIITNYLEFNNHVPNLDDEDRVKLLNRFRTELPISELTTPDVSNSYSDCCNAVIDTDEQSLYVCTNCGDRI